MMAPPMASRFGLPFDNQTAMCGIAGQFNYARGESVEEDSIRRMARSIAHRGPDDEGYFLSGSLGLGFRRLSIIDLSGGHQPMSDADETVWIVFNGEIYNFKELRIELEQYGHRFRTNSDTEVIVHGYKEWGTGVFDRLNGMFGVAIWDILRKRLVLARDAMGIKLVYFRNQNGRLIFGSEIRSITAADQTVPVVDPAAVRLFLRFRYTPSPMTIYQGIRKLAAGAMLIVEEGRCREERWYRYKPVPFSSDKEAEEAREELLALYRAAVRRHLLSDVPVGLLLSGGLDSGLLLALMSECGRDWPAYTVGYGSTFRDDELSDAAESARLLGAKCIRIKIDRREFERSLQEVIRFLEEPVASSSIVPMYFVCQRARQDVKVALIGQGPDELFGGYTRHLGVHYGSTWRAIPEVARGMIGAVLRRLPRNEAIKRGVHALAVRNRVERYQEVFTLVPDTIVSDLFRDPYSSKDGSGFDSWHSLEPQMEHLDELGGFQLLEIRSSLPDELLMFADKLSMAHGLEARVPYLDRTVVEFGQRLDSRMKIRHGKRKWVHREVCRTFLPRKILNRKKRGFAVNVVDEWLKSTSNGLLADSLLSSDSRMFAFMDRKGVKRLMEEHSSGRQDHHKLLFSLVVLEQILRTAQ
jgi:asparagine synthase (glutamine-hydrolysing)